MIERESPLTKAERQAREVLQRGLLAFRESYGAVPFGAERRSRRAIRASFESLTPAMLEALIDLHGRAAVNRWLGREIRLRMRRESQGE